MSDAHEIIRLAIVGSGANFGSHAAATRVLAALRSQGVDARAFDPAERRLLKRVSLAGGWPF